MTRVIRVFLWGLMFSMASMARAGSNANAPVSPTAWGIKPTDYQHWRVMIAPYGFFWA